MALDDRYVITPPLNQYFVDKTTGLPLAGGKLYFWRDSSRNVPKTVYQLTGAPPNYTYTALPNPVILSSVGTALNASNEQVEIYLYPYDTDGNLDLYYIECKDANEGPQFVREAMPNLTAEDNPAADNTAIDNQITNPQFGAVLLNEGFSTVYTVSGTQQTFPIAPDWILIANGTGTITVSRVAIPGNQAVVTSPPYVLDIDISTGVSLCYLSQRMNTNSGLWASTAAQDIFLTGSYVAKSLVVTTTQIEMLYQESSGGTPISIFTGAVNSAGFSTQKGTTAAKIPTSNDTNSGSSGYVDIYLSFLPGSHIQISSIQVVPVGSFSAGDNVSYDLNSSNRETALLGNYYLPRLNQKPIASLLTGWDFSLNPAQFGGDSQVFGAAGAAYVWDQTIMQSQNTTCTVNRNALQGALQVQSTAPVEAFYMLQYLKGSEAKKILGTRLSVNVNAYGSATASNNVLRVYLYRAPTAGLFPTIPLTIGTCNSSGVFTLTGAAVASGWTEIPRSGADTAKATLVNITGTDIPANSDYGFSGWQLTDLTQIGDTDKFAIVVTCTLPVSLSAAVINSVSLCPGDIPTRPAAQTADEVLRECMYYYETTKNRNVPLTTAGDEGARIKIMQTFFDTVVPAWDLITTPFSVDFLVKKFSATPFVKYYAENGAADNVTAYIYRNGAQVGASVNVPILGTPSLTAYWTPFGIGQAGVQAFPNTARTGGAAKLPTITATGNSTVLVTGAISFHYYADSRFGVIVLT